MTEEEICREYRGAKDKKKQITILADQNVCPKAAILQILANGGEDIGHMRPKAANKEKGALPGVIVAALFEKLEQIEKELAEKEEEYKQIADFIMNYSKRQEAADEEK